MTELLKLCPFTQLLPINHIDIHRPHFLYWVILMLCTSAQSLATWETESKMHCRQTLLDGNGPKTYWTRELKGDELILVRNVLVFIVLFNKPYTPVYRILYKQLIIAPLLHPNEKHLCRLPKLNKTF